MGLSFQHILILLVVVLLLFGRNKISDLMGDFAKGIKAFKKGMSDDEIETTKSDSIKTIDNNGKPANLQPNTQRQDTAV